MDKFQRSFQKTIDFEKEQMKRINQEKEDFAANITPEQMAAMEAEVDNFIGTKHNLAKEEKHKKIGRAMELLYLSDNSIVRWNSEQANREQRNACSSIDIYTTMFLDDKSLAAFNMAVSLADDVALVVTGDDLVRITFGVRDIWEYSAEQAML